MEQNTHSIAVDRSLLAQVGGNIESHDAIRRIEIRQDREIAEQQEKGQDVQSIQADRDLLQSLAGYAESQRIVSRQDIENAHQQQMLKEFGIDAEALFIPQLSQLTIKPSIPGALDQSARTPGYKPKKPGGGTKLVKLHRHVRNGRIDPKTQERSILSHGGISFYIEILDRDVEPMFSFSFAVTADDENFNGKLGNTISSGRFAAGQFLAGMYQRDYSLVQNIAMVLADRIAEMGQYNENSTDPVPEWNVKWAAIRDVAGKLSRFTRRLPRETPAGFGIGFS